MKLATLVYVQHGGHTLMLHKAKGYQQGKWNGLGGKFDKGESPEECMKRETFEESGLLVEAAQLRGFLSWPDFDGEDDWYAFIYTVSKFSGELKASDEGELTWIPNDAVMNLNLWPGDRVFLPWVFEGKFFSGKFIYEGGEFKDYSVVFYSQ
ncbi:MAG: NUDIX hydrolase [Trueperaceae bacterium]